MHCILRKPGENYSVCENYRKNFFKKNEKHVKMITEKCCKNDKNLLSLDKNEIETGVQNKILRRNNYG